MIYISHRGNINGKNPEMENHPDYIQTALNKGYDVEIDVWVKDDIIYLGHDKPEYKIDLKWFFDRVNKVWIHCKNKEALMLFNNLIQYRNESLQHNYFWHQNDDYTLTSKNYIWTYPNKKIIGNYSIAVLPELHPDWDISKAIGICSDFIEKYKNKLYI